MLLININKFMRYKYTDKDIEFLKENYPLGNWDKIMERFPNLSRHVVNSKMHKLGISFYSNDELLLILERFLSIQNTYPLGECIDKKLHTLFHSLYGQYYNTPEQWHRFKEDYLKGIYINID